MKKGFVLAALLVTSLAMSAPAWAAEPTAADIAQARDLSVQAQQTFEAGNYAESEKLWIAAEKLYPAAPTLTLGLARTQAKLGKLVAAQESYKKIIRENENNTNLSPAFKDALDAARNEVSSVSDKIANVVISVEGPSAPTVTIDGQPVSSSALGLKRPVDPGSHVVKAEAPGFKPAEVSFQVAAAGLAEAKVHMEKAPEAPPPPGTTVTLAPKKSSNKTLALVAFGVGGAGLVFGSITGILAIGKHGDLNDKCPDGRCPADAQSDVDSYKTMGTLSTVGFIVAGVGAAAGAVLWLTAPSAKETGKLTVHPYVGVGGGGVAGSF